MDRVTDIYSRKREPADPPYIDAESWRLLVELSADLAVCQAVANHTHHRTDLHRIAAQLNNRLNRLGPPKGVA